MSLVYLLIAFVLTGLTAILSKALVELHLYQYRDIYVLMSYLVPLVFGFIYLSATKQKGSKDDAKVGSMMGFFGSISLISFIIVLSLTTGVVAFPLRSLGNLILTAMISIIAWKERPSKSQWLGIALSLVAIWLISPH